MEAKAQLERLERILDSSAVAERIEALLPVGVRPRQLRVRTLLLGMLLVACDGRPAHLSRVHEALIGLPEAEQRRLGVIGRVEGRPPPSHLPPGGAHLLAPRQGARLRGARRDPLGGAL